MGGRSGHGPRRRLLRRGRALPSPEYSAGILAGWVFAQPVPDDRDWTNNGNRNDNRDRRGRNWDRYGTYGGSFQLRQTALNSGYNEGLKVGREDRNRNRGFDFRNSSVYEAASKDYSSSLGDRELYRRYFREGCENGYDDEYNGY